MTMILLLVLMGCSVTAGGLSIPEINGLNDAGYKVYNCSTSRRSNLLPETSYTAWLIVPKETPPPASMASS